MPPTWYELFAVDPFFYGFLLCPVSRLSYIVHWLTLLLLLYCACLHCCLLLSVRLYTARIGLRFKVQSLEVDMSEGEETHDSLQALSYKALQALAKKRGVKANLSKGLLIEHLLAAKVWTTFVTVAHSIEKGSPCSVKLR